MNKYLYIKFCFLLAVFLISADLFAQVLTEKENNKKYSYSVNLGLSFTRITPLEDYCSNWTDYGAKKGLLIGGSIIREFNDAVLIEAGINIEKIFYNIQYYRLDTDKWGSRVTTQADYEMQIGYIQPVFIPKVRWGNKINVNFGLGICFNIPIFSQIVGTYSKIGYIGWPEGGQYNTVLENNQIVNDPRFFYEPIVSLKINFPISKQLFGVGITYRSSISYQISNTNYLDKFSRDQIISSIYYYF